MIDAHSDAVAALGHCDLHSAFISLHALHGPDPNVPLSVECSIKKHFMSTRQVKQVKILVPHVVPEKPDAQAQLKVVASTSSSVASTFEQVPPFKQGLLSHGNARRCRFR